MLHASIARRVNQGQPYSDAMTQAGKVTTWLQRFEQVVCAAVELATVKFKSVAFPLKL